MSHLVPLLEFNQNRYKNILSKRAACGAIVRDTCAVKGSFALARSVSQDQWALDNDWT
jgi:hypothetical protein